jgi:signal transduction histidine kinase
MILVSIWAINTNSIKDIPKKSLIFLFLAFVSWFTAEQIWMLYDYVFLIDPFPSIADIFYIAAPIFMLTSLLVFLRPLKNQITKKMIIVAMCCSILLLIPTVLITYTESSDSDLVELIIVMIYPIIDAIIIIPVIITVLFLIQTKKNPFWIMFLLGIIVLIVADTLYLFFELIGEYTDNHPIDLLWLVSYLFWTFSLLRIIQNAKKSDDVGFNIKNYKKYETQLLSKYGILSFLIIINIAIVSVLFSINYLSENQTNFEFLKFFTVFLLMITVIFSILIIFLNKTLQSDLKIKTSELDHISQEIIKSEKLSAIGQLSSRMAHDIRNPLTIIRISLENIKLNYGVNESQDKSFKKIVRSIDRITHQIDGVLDFVKGHTPLLRTVKFSEIIADSIDSLVIPDDLELITPKNDVTFLVDKRLFTVAMINLILNAIQAVNNKGTIEITIEENKDTVIIQVKDSGIGISSENLDKIFEPLFTTKLSGTGLGLVGVKSIIESHQGKISVTSPPTVFTISLPKIIEEIDD